MDEQVLQYMVRYAVLSPRDRTRIVPADGQTVMARLHRSGFLWGGDTPHEISCRTTISTLLETLVDSRVPLPDRVNFLLEFRSTQPIELSGSGEEAAAHVVLSSSCSVAPPPFGTCDLQGVLRTLRQCGPESVIVVCGAGISVAAGVTLPTKGRYLFDAEYLKDDPNAFNEGLLHFATRALRAEPQPAHRFIARLAALGLLSRCYTQNLDLLETRAGVDEQTYVSYVHGSLREGKCPTCHATGQPFLANVGSELPSCEAAACRRTTEQQLTTTEGVRPRPPLHPCVTLRNDTSDPEALPLPATASLVLVLGTKLNVLPFCDAIERLQCPRVFINTRLEEQQGYYPERRVAPGERWYSDVFLQMCCQRFAKEADAALTMGLLPAGCDEAHRWPLSWGSSVDSDISGSTATSSSALVVARRQAPPPVVTQRNRRSERLPSLAAEQQQQPKPRQPTAESKPSLRGSLMALASASEEG